MTGPVAVVTGASRGAGRGIALALGERGYTVYVTGRSSTPAAAPGSIEATVAEINQLGGTAIAVRCDHADAEQTAALFHRVGAEQGRLDILVNNATLVHEALASPGPFWEKPLELAGILDVGLRSAYVASFCAAAWLLANGRGLIVNTSSFGSRCYMHGPAYGAQKSGLDKMTHDMARDFRPHAVAVVSIWMGMLRTERTEVAIRRDPARYAPFIEGMESPQFTGLVIDALYRDDRLMELSGQTLIGAEQAARYGIRDIGGGRPPSHRGWLGDPPVWHPAVVE